MEWDEEFALQDFLKNEIAERNCRAQDGPTDGKPEETVVKITDGVEEEDGEERWMVVDEAGEGEARGTSTPLSTLSGEAQSAHGSVGRRQGEWGRLRGPLPPADTYYKSV